MPLVFLIWWSLLFWLEFQSVHVTTFTQCFLVMWCRFIEPILVTGNFRKSFIKLIASGMFRIMLGGWLDLLCMYRGVVAGFENGLNLPVVRSRVTSRKLTIFLFASMVIRRLFWANILHISFLIFSFSGKKVHQHSPPVPLIILH